MKTNLFQYPTTNIQYPIFKGGPQLSTPESLALPYQRTIFDSLFKCGTVQFGYWILIIGCWLLMQTGSLFAQTSTDTLPVSIRSQDRAGLLDPAMVRVKTSAAEFTSALSPIFNGTVSLRVDDELMYPLNRYQDQGIFDERFAARADQYDREVALLRPQLRSAETVGSAFILAVRQLNGDGLSMQVRFKVKLPAIESLNLEEQNSLEADLAAAGEKAADGGSGGAAVAKGIDAMRVELDNLNREEETPNGTRYRIVNCTVLNQGTVFVAPSGVVVITPNGANFIPGIYDNNQQGWPRGTLASFQLDGEEYIGLWKPGTKVFDGYIKKADWEKVKDQNLTLEELQNKNLMFNGFSIGNNSEYDLEINISNGGIVQLYKFKYSPTKFDQIIGKRLETGIIPQDIFPNCDFCSSHSNSPGFKYYKDQLDSTPNASSAEKQIWCENAKAFNTMAGQFVDDEDFDVAYWDNFMRQVYAETLPFILTADGTRAQYIAGLYIFANWYATVEKSLNTINDQDLMTLSLMWLPKEVLRQLSCSTKLKIIDVLFSEKLTGLNLLTNESPRDAFIRLMNNPGLHAQCIVDALLIKNYNTIAQQDLVALTVVGLPDESLQALDCTTYTKVINAFLSQSLNSNESKTGLLKLFKNSADLAPCLFQLLKGSCTYSSNLFKSYKGEQLMILADLLSKLTLIAMKDWSAADLRAVYKGDKYYIGKLPKIYCRVNPQINIDAKIQGCKINLKYSYPIVEEVFNCGTLKFRTGEYNFFDLIVLIPISNVNEWTADQIQIQVVPASMLLYLSSEQEAVRNDAALAGGTVVGSIVTAALSFGIITSAEVGALTQSAALLGALGGLTEATVIVAEDEIKKLFDNQEDANEFIGIIKAVSLSLMAIDAAVNLPQLAVNIVKAGVLLAKVTGPKLASKTYLMLQAFIAQAKLILKIGGMPAKEALEAILYQNWVVVTRTLSDFTDLAKQYSSIVAARLIQSGKGQDFLLFLKTEFYTLYATKGANGDAIRKLLLSLIDRKWDKPELFAELVADLAGNGRLLEKLASVTDDVTRNKWISAYEMLKNTQFYKSLSTNTDELKLIVDNFDEIVRVGGYVEWKLLKGGQIIKDGKVYGEFQNGSFLEITTKPPLFGGNRIELSPTVTVTITGTLDDVGSVAFRGSIMEGITKQGENIGRINILRSPKWAELQSKYDYLRSQSLELFWKKVTDEFWETVNKPWLDEAISRGDIIRVVSDASLERSLFVTNNNMFVLDVSGNRIPSIFSRELEYLRQRGYTIQSNGLVTK